MGNTALTALYLFFISVLLAGCGGGPGDKSLFTSNSASSCTGSICNNVLDTDATSIRLTTDGIFMKANECHLSIAGVCNPADNEENQIIGTLLDASSNPVVAAGLTNPRAETRCENGHFFIVFRRWQAGVGPGFVRYGYKVLMQVRKKSTDTTWTDGPSNAINNIQVEEPFSSVVNPGFCNFAANMNPPAAFSFLLPP